VWELTVARFFASTGDDYYALHGEGDIEVEYERPPAQETTQPYIAKVWVRMTFTKQEAVS
jgi:hypothetical protein